MTVKIAPEKFKPISAISEHPHQFGRWALSYVIGEFASKEEAEMAQGILDTFIQKTFVLVKEEPAIAPIPKEQQH